MLMLIVMGIVAFALLFLGCPFVITLTTTALVVAFIFLPDLNLTILLQQILGGIKPAALVCIPMFILAAGIITEGEAGQRLVNFVRSNIGHIYGGSPIATNVTCTLFGAVSGSTSATVASIGKVMRPMLLRDGYSSSFSLGLIINSSDIALLIPPSVGLIIYGVVTNTSIGQLFLAGIIPGLLICLLFSVYAFLYSKVKDIGRSQKASWAERRDSTKKAVGLSGFPLIILGGIYSGIFTPTEAAAAAVVYALVLEGLIYRSLHIKKLPGILLETGLITAVCLVLVGIGQALSWLISYTKLPELFIPYLFGQDPSYLRVVIMVCVSYFVACMFVDPIVAIYILSPIFHPYVVQTGINYIFLGTLVILQAAIGTATPPFGSDIFTAQLIFKRPYFEVIKHTPPFIAILLLINVLLIAFPQIVLLLPNAAFGD